MEKVLLHNWYAYRLLFTIHIHGGINMISIGIDVGKSGGVAIIDSIKSENAPITAVKCPETVADMSKLITWHKWDCRDLLCVIEKVHSMPKQGVKSMFTFGKNFGQWLGILAAFEIPYIEVTPQKWMKYYGAMPKDKKERKTHLKHLAQSLYPSINVTLYTADAILMAHYCKQELNI
tara:strand:+ start:2458 stop:2988 length:531 start_codon:yes stop_codon:yes gene_type:complete